MTAASDGPGWAERLERLEARAAIETLMQRYAAAADRKYTAARTRQPPDAVAAAARDQAACFAEDAEWSADSFGGSLRGRAAIEAFFARSPWRFTAHHYGSPDFVFRAAAVDVRWRLLEIGAREGDGRVMLLTGTVAQTCRRTADGWRIARMAFETLHAVALADSADAIRCLIPLGEAL